MTSIKCCRRYNFDSMGVFTMAVSGLIVEHAIWIMTRNNFQTAVSEKINLRPLLNFQSQN